MRLYASTYPQQVAGLVLVDSSHEDQDRYPELRPSGTNLLPLCTIRSGHYIQLDQPDLVIAAINQVLTGKA